MPPLREAAKRCLQAVSDSAVGKRKSEIYTFDKITSYEKDEYC
jgi:hypothetical protein